MLNFSFSVEPVCESCREVLPHSSFTSFPNKNPFERVFAVGPCVNPKCKDYNPISKPNLVDPPMPPHNILKDVDSEWSVTSGRYEATCHTRMVGGVLCRWWGDDVDPSGVHLINKAIELRAAQGSGQNCSPEAGPTNSDYTQCNTAHRVVIDDNCWRCSDCGQAFDWL